MAETTTDVRIAISEELPSNLAARLEALNANLTGNAETGCLALQTFFKELTLYCVRSAEITLAEAFPGRSAELSKSSDSLEQLRTKLAAAIDELAQLPEDHAAASLFFRIFYVGGVKAKDTSPRRHSRLLDVGGKNIPGYRTLVEWCGLAVGQDELKGDQRCTRELRRYVPVAKEWLQAIGKHTAKLPEVNLEDSSSGSGASSPAAPDSAAPAQPSVVEQPAPKVAEETPSVAASPAATKPEATAKAAPKETPVQEPQAASPAAAKPEATPKAAAKETPVQEPKEAAPAAAKTGVTTKAAPKETPVQEPKEAAPAAAKTTKAATKETPVQEPKAAPAKTEVASKTVVPKTPSEKPATETKAEKTTPKSKAVDTTPALDGVKASPDTKSSTAIKSESSRKAESRAAGTRTSSATKGHVPSIFTAPLKEMLAATQAKQTEKVNRQLSLISVRILQYSYSIGLATLEALDQSTANFRIASGVIPASYHALEVKAEKLLEIEAYFRDNSEELTELESTIDLVQRLLAETIQSKDVLLELAKLPTREGFASETGWAAKGLTRIKGWIEKAMPFCSRAEHYLDESTDEGVTFGVVQFGDWALEFEEENLRIYSDFVKESHLPQAPVEPAEPVVAATPEPVAPAAAPEAAEPVVAAAPEPVTPAAAPEPAEPVVAATQEPVAPAAAPEPAEPVVAETQEPVAPAAVPEATEPVVAAAPESTPKEAPAVVASANDTPETAVAGAAKNSPLTASDTKPESETKLTLAQAILAAAAAAQPEPAPVDVAPVVVVSAMPTAELDAELLFSLQHCGVPPFLKSAWSNGLSLELRVRMLYDLWGQYFSSILAASEKVREVEHCAEASPRSQVSLKAQLAALNSTAELESQFGAELAGVFWDTKSAALPHNHFLITLESDALCKPLDGAQTHLWLSCLKQWVESSRDFWGATEQLFEDPNSEGGLEGVVVYGEQYLELVECPLQLNFPETWIEPVSATPDPEATQAAAPIEELAAETSPQPAAPAQAEQTAVPQAPPQEPIAANLDWELIETAPPYLLERLELHKNGELTREQALLESFRFLIQYYAGVVACAGIQLRDLDVSSIEAYTHDSAIEARREMLDQLLPESLASESDVFKEMAQVWNVADGQSIKECTSLNYWNVSASPELPVYWQNVCAQWLQNSNLFWQHCEHHCEDSDEQRQDIVVQFKGDFFELVHPDYSLELAPKVADVPEAEIAAASAALVSQAAKPAVHPPLVEVAPEAAAELVTEAAPEPSGVLLGAVEVPSSSDTLFGGVEASPDSLFVGAASPADLLDGPPSLEGAPAIEADSLFGAQSLSSNDIDSLFQVEPETDWIEKLNQPTPVVEEPKVPKAKATAPDPVASIFAVQPETEAPATVATPTVAEEPKTKVRPTKQDATAVVDTTPKVSQSTTVVTDLLDSILSESEAKKAKAKETSDREAEQKAEKVRVDEAAKAEVAAIEAGVPSPTGVPCLEVVIQYAEKKQGVHTGTLLLKNIGGGTLKGTLKSLHPSVRLRPTVFRENDTTVEFSIDDADKPGNLKKNALAVNLQGGAKQELNFDRLLPAAGLAQIRTKVFDLVKQLGKGKKPKV